MPETTSGYVSLYKTNTWWNKVLYSGSVTYGYNYYRNVVACFADVNSGKVYQQYQNNGYWYNGSTVYSVGAGYMTAYGYDNNKGCKWTGGYSYNKGNFIELIYD